MNGNSQAQPTPEYAGLLRRLGAIFYDLILLLAILMLAGALAILVNQGKAVQPGDAIYPVFVLILPIIIFYYFGWFWTHGGQTPGMKTWRLQLVSDTGSRIGWPLCALRMAVAVLSWAVAGAGFLWALLQPQKKTWHDIATGCSVRLVRPGSVKPS